MQDWQKQILEREQFKKRDMQTQTIYQVLDDLTAFAENLGSEWMEERLAMLEAHIGVLEINQSSK